MTIQGALTFLTQDILHLKGIAKETVGAYTKLMGTKIFDVLCHVPFAVERRSQCFSLSDKREPDSPSPRDFDTLVVQVDRHDSKRGKRGLKIRCYHGYDRIDLVFFRAYPRFLLKIAPPGKRILVSGKVCKNPYSQKWEMVHPDHIGEPHEINDWLGIKPIYPLTQGLDQKSVRRVILSALSECPSSLQEWIDPDLLGRFQWPTWKDALISIHHSPLEEALSIPNSRALQRVLYDELLAHELSLHLASRSEISAVPQVGNGHLQEKLIHALPFSLTSSQIGALGEIKDDLSKPRQMLRLLQGDVGSGKTIVAVLAALQSLESGHQVAFLVPTDILACQHFKTLSGWLEPLGVKVILLTGSTKNKANLLKKLEEGAAHVTVGTHALIQKPVSFKNLGFVIIDEQHRFGVEQRIALSAKGRVPPHILSMTATPIPRTLMLAQYGEMDVSILRQKPANRKPIVTRILPLNRLEEVINNLQRIMASSQTKAYWICPLIEESAANDWTALVERYAYLSALFPEKVAFVHGRIKNNEKDRVMEAFSVGEARILVSTTVIEVGIDIPSATLMVIEHAERFGLAQLHQLRGRVGRSDAASVCLLLYASPLTSIARKRLSVMRESDDGFVIAEADLKLRGGGEILGTKQSGLPVFRFFDLKDKDPKNIEGFSKLLERAHKDAREILRVDPSLETERGKALRTLLHLFEKENIPLYKRSG